ncbi:alcohol dehydrogenase [Trichoderma velutinum]
MAAKHIFLVPGKKIRTLGFETFQDTDEQEHYTAHNYGTKHQVGNRIKRSEISRDEIFITTKLWCNAHPPDDVEPALDESFTDLDTDYVDLHLMHHSCSFQCDPDFLPFEKDGKMITDPTDFIDTWNVMEKLSTRDWKKRIRIIRSSPCGNLNTFYRDISWAKDLAQRGRLIDNRILVKIAEKHKKSPIQIAFAWRIQHGRCVIPKSTIEWQLKENTEAENIVLDEEDISAIASINQKARFNDPSADFGYKLYVGLDGAAS